MRKKSESDENLKEARAIVSQLGNEKRLSRRDKRLVGMTRKYLDRHGTAARIGQHQLKFLRDLKQKVT